MTLAAATATMPVAGRVIDCWDETPSLRAVQAALPPDWAIAHQRPGQVVKLRAAGRESYFALASAPSREGVVELLLKRGSRIVDAAIADATPGAALYISPPLGKGFPVEEAYGRHVLLFAAGSGIAPIRALVQHILRHRVEFDRVTLFYGQRRGSDFAYTREHVSWERGGVRVVLCPSAEGEAWPGARGRVQDVALSTAFCGSPPQNSVTFLCGMKAMVDEVKDALSRAGVPPSRVHLNF